MDQILALDGSPSWDVFSLIISTQLKLHETFNLVQKLKEQLRGRASREILIKFGFGIS